MISATRLQVHPRWRFWGQSTRALPRIVAVTLLLMIAVWLAYGLWQAKQKSERIAEHQQSITRLDQSINVKASPSSKINQQATAGQSSASSFGLPNKNLDASPEQRRQINSIIRQLNTPWHHLFDQLESSTPRDVSLVSIEPDAKRGTIRLQAEARTLDTLLTYVARLQHQGVLGPLTYSKHETNEQDSNKPVRLSVEYGLLAETTITGGQK